MFIAGIVAAAVIAAAGALVVIFSGVYNVAADSGHYPAVAWVLGTMKNVSIHRHAKNLDLPADGNLAQGAHEYDEMCVVCHGGPGKEPSAIGKGLLPSPPQMTTAANEFSPQEIFWVTKNGVKFSGMPAFGATHDDPTIRSITTYISSGLPNVDVTAYAEAAPPVESTHAAQGSP
jgi:mono/diheme cytochrome c family protein